MHSLNAAKDSDEFWRIVYAQIGSSNYNFVGYVFPRQVFFDQVSFSKRADFRDAEFLEDVSFAGSKFLGAGFGEAKFGKRAYFNSATFSYGVNFDGARFSNWVDFTNTEFLTGGADFSNVEFQGEAGFDGATFSDTSASARSDFTDAVFSGEASFGNAKFLGGIDFRRTTFSRVANFAKATFSGGAGFVGAKFLGRVDFMRSKWQQSGADFGTAEFSGEVDFSESEFLDAVDFSDAKFLSRALFNHVTFAIWARFRTDLQHVIFRSMDLRHCRFAESSNLDKAEFDNVEWAQWSYMQLRWGPSRLAIADEIDARTGSIFYVWADKRHTLRAAERVYRALRANFEARKDHPRLGGFYFAEMEMRRLASSSSWAGRTFGSLTAWYGLISGYGERWIRAFGWFGSLCLMWALLYLVVGLWIKIPEINDKGVIETHTVFVGLASAPAGVPAVSGLQERYAHALLHSVLVATLIGRDVYAQPINALGQLAQTFELLLGPLFLGLTGLAVRRQFQR